MISLLPKLFYPHFWWLKHFQGFFSLLYFDHWKIIKTHGWCIKVMDLSSKYQWAHNSQLFQKISIILIWHKIILQNYHSQRHAVSKNHTYAILKSWYIMFWVFKINMAEHKKTDVELEFNNKFRIAAQSNTISFTSYTILPSPCWSWRTEQ